MKFTKRRQMLVEHGLRDENFRGMVEKDIGLVYKVDVDWGTDEIIVHGELESRAMSLPEFIAAVEADIKSEEE